LEGKHHFQFQFEFVSFWNVDIPKIDALLFIKIQNRIRLLFVMIFRHEENSELCYSNVQVFFFLKSFFGLLSLQSTALMPSSNTAFRPLCVSAEHSIYSTALISWAICTPYGRSFNQTANHLITIKGVIGVTCLSVSFCTASLSFRKSVIVPTSNTFASGQ